MKQPFRARHLVKVKIKHLNYFICDGFCDIAPLDSLKNVQTNYRGVLFLVRKTLDLEPQTLDLETKTLLQKVFTFCKKVKSLLLSKTLYMVLFVRCFLYDVRFSTNYVWLCFLVMFFSPKPGFHFYNLRKRFQGGGV